MPLCRFSLSGRHFLGSAVVVSSRVLSSPFCVLLPHFLIRPSNRFCLMFAFGILALAPFDFSLGLRASGPRVHFYIRASSFVPGLCFLWCSSILPACSRSSLFILPFRPWLFNFVGSPALCPAGWALLFSSIAASWSSTFGHFPFSLSIRF